MNWLLSGLLGGQVACILMALVLLWLNNWADKQRERWRHGR